MPTPVEEMIEEVINKARAITSHYFTFFLIDNQKAIDMTGGEATAFFAEDLMYINKDKITPGDKKKFVFLAFHEIGHRFVLPRTTDIMILAMLVIHSSFVSWMRDSGRDEWFETLENKKLASVYGVSTIDALRWQPYAKTIQNVIDDTALNYFWCKAKNVNELYPNYYYETMMKEYAVEDSFLRTSWGIHTMCNTSLAEIASGKPIDVYPLNMAAKLSPEQKQHMLEIINIYVDWIKDDNFMISEKCVESYRSICFCFMKLYRDDFFESRQVQPEAILRSLISATTYKESAHP